MEINILLFCVQLIVLSILVAALAMAFQKFMQPNNILYPYSYLLCVIANKGEVWRHLMRPLGRCRYCNSVWIGFYVFHYFYGYSLTVLLFAGLIVMFVRLMTDYIWIDIDPADYIDNKVGVKFANPDTPYQAMLKSYIILGSFYFCIYGLPFIIHKL